MQQPVSPITDLDCQAQEVRHPFMVSIAVTVSAVKGKFGGIINGQAVCCLRNTKSRIHIVDEADWDCSAIDSDVTACSKV